MLRWFGHFKRIDNEKLMKQNRYKKEHMQQCAWNKERGRCSEILREDYSRAATSQPPVVRDQKIDEEKGTQKIARSYGLLNLSYIDGVT